MLDSPGTLAFVKGFFQLAMFHFHDCFKERNVFLITDSNFRPPGVQGTNVILHPKSLLPSGARLPEGKKRRGPPPLRRASVDVGLEFSL